MGTPIVTADVQAAAGGLWTAVLSGLKDAHSVIIEAWGANGAVARIFPRGRDEMTIQLRFSQPGDTMVSLSFRDAELRVGDRVIVPVSVTAGQTVGGQAQRGFGSPLRQGVAPMPAAKPPMTQLEGHDGGAPAFGSFRAAAPAPGGMDVYADAGATVGHPWSLDITGISDAHSVVIEMFGANGGLHRIFPRERNTMSLTYRFASPGVTHIGVMARDETRTTIATLNFPIEVSPAQMAGLAPAPVGRTRPVNDPRPVQPLGVAKPPMASLEGHDEGFGRHPAPTPNTQGGAPSGIPHVQPPSTSTMTIADAMQKSIEDRIRSRSSRRDT